MVKSTIVFYDESFPFEGERPDLSGLFEDSDTRIVNADELAETLLAEGTDVYVHLHGAYFPKTAWPSILAFLQKGWRASTYWWYPFSNSSLSGK